MVQTPTRGCPVVARARLAGDYAVGDLVVFEVRKEPGKGVHIRRKIVKGRMAVSSVKGNAG